MNTDLMEAETTLAVLPARKYGWGGPRYKNTSTHAKGNDRLHSPSSDLEEIERRCIGRGYLGGGCNRTFTATGRYNRMCLACTSYATRYGA